MSHSSIKGARVRPNRQNQRTEYWVMHPCNDAILAACDTLEEAERFVADINAASDFVARRTP